MASPGVLVHGGAGDLRGERVPSHVEGCVRAARAGAEVLRAGGSSLDAVQRAVEVLEDDPRFNAGTGGCLTADGTLEFDASIMDGASLAAGAVCALPTFRNPIAIARAVLAAGRHVMYAADGARAFAESLGFSLADPESMITPSARERWRDVRAGVGEAAWPGGTVGAVAWDGAHLAAATSTGGMVNKARGRVGDSPVIGAGTLADDTTGATSATGVGEGILRVTLASRVLEFMRAGDSPRRAAERALDMLQARTGKTAGLIVMGADGTPAWAKITRTMTYAYATIDGREESGA